MSNPVNTPFSRTNAVPLDETSVFNSKAEADAYVTATPTTAYPGQLITVLVNSTAVIYRVVKSGDKLTLKSVATNNSATLSWGNSSTIASINDTDITVTLPSVPSVPKASQSSYGTAKIWADGSTLYISTQ